MQKTTAVLYARLNGYNENPETFNEEQKQNLLNDTASFLDDYLADKIVFETDAAPELLILFQKAVVFDVLQKKVIQARKKLCQQLNAFDQRYGLLGLENIPDQVMEKNIDKIGVLSQMPITTRPAFQQLFNIVDHIDLTDDNGVSMGQEGHDRLQDTLISLSKTDTFFCLLGASHLTVDDYFAVLHDALQINLIALLYTDEIAVHYPLSEDMREKAKTYMAKLIDMIK